MDTGHFLQGSQVLFSEESSAFMRMGASTGHTCVLGIQSDIPCTQRSISYVKIQIGFR